MSNLEDDTLEEINELIDSVEGDDLALWYTWDKELMS